MIARPSSGFLLSFEAVVPRGTETYLMAGVPRSWTTAIFQQLGYPPSADPQEVQRRPDPPIVILPAPRWPGPSERDEAVKAEAALDCIEALLTRPDFILDEVVAKRAVRLVQRLIEEAAFAPAGEP